MKPQLEPVSVALATRARPHTTVYRHTGMFDGSVLTVSYLVDDAEHEKRQANGIGGVVDERVLAALMELPADGLEPVSGRFRLLFDDPATSAVAVIVDDPDAQRWGRRLLNAPVEILGLDIVARDWADGRDVAHKWVGYGSRVVHVERMPCEDVTFTLTEAAHYGVGVVSGPDSHLLEPSPYRPRRWTSARWRFAEQVYEQFLSLG